MADPKTVIIRAQNGERSDGVASAAITPGMLIEMSGTEGTERTYQPHSTAGGETLSDFAIQGKAGRGIEQDYPSGAYIEHKAFQPGDEVYALLATGSNVAVGDQLVSKGDGTLGASGGGGGAPIALATESIDNSGGSGAVRIVAEVI